MDKTRPAPTSEPSSLSLLTAWLELGDQVLVDRDGSQHSLKSSLLAYEELVVVSAWSSHGQNITHTAAALGVSRRRIRRVLNRWNATRKGSAESPAEVDARPGARGEEPSHAPADQ